MSTAAGSQRLVGAKVLITRPRERAQELCFLLEDEGAQVMQLPLLELAPPDDPRALNSAAEAVHRYAWVLFASPAGVEALVEATRQAGTMGSLCKAKVGVVGARTAQAVRAFGLEVTAQADLATGAGLAEVVAPKLGPDDEVLVPSAQEGRRELVDALKGAGARVTQVAAYKAVSSPVDRATRDSLLRDPPNLVLFGSPRTAQAFLAEVGAEAKALLRAAHLIAIGPTTAGALAELGLAAAAVAEQPSPAGLVEATVRAFRGQV